MNIETTLGYRLKSQRKKLGMNQTELAHLLRITRQSQMNYESNLRDVSGRYLREIDSLGADIYWIVTGKEQISNVQNMEEINADAKKDIRKITFKNPCIAKAEHVDFEEGTWTFKPIKNFLVSPDYYAIMPLLELFNKYQFIDELLAVFLETYHFAELAQRGKTPNAWLIRARLVYAKIEGST